MPTLFEWALDDYKDIEKLRYIAKLFDPSSKDNVIQLFLAIAHNDYDIIPSLIARDPASVTHSDLYMTPFDYAMRIGAWEIAELLLSTYIQLGADKIDLLHLIEILLQHMIPSFDVDSEKERFRKILLRLVGLVESNETLHARLIQHVLYLYISSLQTSQTSEEINRLAQATLRMIKDKSEDVEFRSKTLAIIFNNLAVTLSKEKANKSIFALYQVVLNLTPPHYLFRENFLFNALTYALDLENLPFVMQFAKYIADFEISKYEPLKEKEKNRDWFDYVILPLLHKQTTKTCKAAEVFLKLAITMAPHETTEDKSHYALLSFAMAATYLMLGDDDAAQEIFYSLNLKNDEFLDDDAFYTLVYAAAYFAKHQNSHPLLFAYELNPHRFVECLAEKILAGDCREEVEIILKTLREAGLMPHIAKNCPLPVLKSYEGILQEEPNLASLSLSDIEIPSPSEIMRETKSPVTSRLNFFASRWGSPVSLSSHPRPVVDEKPKKAF